jgi:hypothetical protein
MSIGCVSVLGHPRTHALEQSYSSALCSNALHELTSAAVSSTSSSGSATAAVLTEHWCTQRALVLYRSHAEVSSHVSDLYRLVKSQTICVNHSSLLQDGSGYHR